MEAKAVRLRRGRRIHATADYQRTLCGKHCVGLTLKADAVPDCRGCLEALWDAAK